MFKLTLKAWLIALAVIIALSLLGFAGTYMSRIGEYVSFKFSPQTMISEEHRLGTLEAELAKVNSLLSRNPDDSELLAQQAFLEVQINSRK